VAGYQYRYGVFMESLPYRSGGFGAAYPAGYLTVTDGLSVGYKGTGLKNL